MMLPHVFANRSNVGDWLSAMGVQRALVGVQVEELLCDGPFVPETLERLDALAGRDLVVIGGGGLLMDYFESFWRGFLGLRRTPRYVLWGIGFVDLKAEPSRIPLALAREIVDRSSLCIVRDELTRNLIGVERIPEPVLCPSLLSLERDPRPGHGVLHVVNLTTVGQRAYDVMTSVGRSFAISTGRTYTETNNRIKDDSTLLLEETLAAYRACDVVLTSALHGAIIGLALGRPVVAVSGDWKLEGFMSAVGLEDWVLEPDALDPLARLLETAGSQASVEAVLEQHRGRNRAFGAEVVAALHAGELL